MSPISVPHPAAFLKSFLNSRQGLASFYIYLFQLPRLPEWTMLRRDGRFMSRSLQQAGQTPAAAERDARDLLLDWFTAH